MRKAYFTFTFEAFQGCFLAVLAVAGTTALMVLTGRNVLGDAVVALLYLLPIGYSTTRWGQAAGISAALTAALAFDFFFIPPYYTFTVGSMEGWLVLVIFLAVAVLIVGRIQYGLTRAREREKEAIFMYELSSALAGLHDRDAIARIMASQLRQLYQARLVQVSIYSDGSSRIVSLPPDRSAEGSPDRTVPILTGHGLEGEIAIWRGALPLPPEESRLFQSFAIQGALAFERARVEESRSKVER
ncbi:MAG: DUF4118 domain-containing protein [Omnitrophica WOR_2 bacterium]